MAMAANPGDEIPGAGGPRVLYWLRVFLYEDGRFHLPLRVAALLTFAIFLGTSFYRGWTEPETDFPNYYTAAVLVRQGQPLRKFYDWTWFARQMNYGGGGRRWGRIRAQPRRRMFPL